MEKDELINFLKWLQEEGIARWYQIDIECGGEGEEKIVENYLKEKEDEVNG